MVKEPTFDSITSPSPSVAIVVTLNPTQNARSIPTNTNREQQTTCNIQISTYPTKSNLLDMKYIYHSRIHYIRNRNINRYIYGKMNNNLY